MFYHLKILTINDVMLTLSEVLNIALLVVHRSITSLTQMENISVI